MEYQASHKYRDWLIKQGQESQGQEAKTETGIVGSRGKNKDQILREQRQEQRLEYQ
jgi:hypothetical protein